jgi:predicted DCC family thiol-disulfide oxidoreductase YuxK
MEPPTDNPLLIFDGDCSFCRRWVKRWQSISRDLVEYEPYQTAAARVPQIQVEQFKRAAFLVEPDGTISRGVRAAFRIWALSGHRSWPLWAYDHLPGFAKLADGAYHVIANHRNRFDRLDRWFIGSHETASTFILSRWLFLRALGIVYLIAFVSYWVQIEGLIGSNGILPIAPALQSAVNPPAGSMREALGAERFWLFPTLLWFGASDRTLNLMCGGGVVLSLLLVAGVAPIVVLLLLWIAYLSLFIGGQIFLSFQWDILLLETGFLAIFLAPGQILPRPSREPRVPRLSWWLLRWLLFRLMFLSGLVKLTFNDDTWWNWTALDYHYFTQPIPTWTSWWMQQVPHWFHVISLVFMWYAELIAPFFIIGPRRLRLVAFWSFLLLQVLIMATGNYGFFNLLAITLCLTLPDDQFWPAWMRRLIRVPARPQPPRRSSWIRTAVATPLAVVIVIVSSMRLVESFNRPIGWPTSMQSLSDSVRQFGSINSYGLFRVMTTKRPEIIIEGSDDGITWKPYEFKWKPGDVNRAPAFVEPHMPRLDWQMWFAALGNYQRDGWVLNLMTRLLEGSPPVLKLLQSNPFPDHPPRYIRAVLYEYRFTDRKTRRESGAWWTRQLRGLWAPVLQRNDPGIGSPFRL